MQKLLGILGRDVDKRRVGGAHVLLPEKALRSLLGVVWVRALFINAVVL